MSDADRGEGGRHAGGQAPGRARRRAVSPETLDERRYYRIGDVSRLTGVKAHVLRYWETEFRWMAPAKSRSKQRLYRKRDIEVIQLIRTLLYEERYTIAGARRRLRELGVARALDGPASAEPAEREASAVAAPVRAEDGATPDPRDALRRIREELVALRAAL
jgi:DNA-binding transcriptional MerR regulator